MNKKNKKKNMIQIFIVIGSVISVGCSMAAFFVNRESSKRINRLESLVTKQIS
jgi:hypothetical protein